MKGEDQSSSRLEICKKCPIYSLDGMCSHKLWLNPKTNDIKTFPSKGYIQGCGCIIKKKILIDFEKCPVGKW